MMMIYSSILLFLSAIATVTANTCHQDQCLKSVSCNGLKPAQKAVRSSDCVSYFKVTVTPAATTVTKTVTSTPRATTTTKSQTIITTAISTAPSTVTTSTVVETVTTSTETTTTFIYEVPTYYKRHVAPPALKEVRHGFVPVVKKHPITVYPSIVPSWASPCRGAAHYSSACACQHNLRYTTITARTPTSTVTKTVTAATPTSTVQTTVVTTVTQTVTTSVTDITTSTTSTDATLTSTIDCPYSTYRPSNAYCEYRIYQCRSPSFGRVPHALTTTLVNDGESCAEVCDSYSGSCGGFSFTSSTCIAWSEQPTASATPDVNWYVGQTISCGILTSATSTSSTSSTSTSTSTATTITVA